MINIDPKAQDAHLIAPNRAHSMSLSKSLTRGFSAVQLFPCLSQAVFQLADRLVKLLARVGVIFGPGCCLLKLSELLFSRGVLLAQCIKLALKSLRVGCFRLAVFQLCDFFSKVIKFLPGTFAIRLPIGAGICFRVAPEIFGFFSYCLG